jgi:hypothetical protein
MEGAKLEGQMVFVNEYAQSVEFTSKLNGQRWTLTNIYAPCTLEGKMAFLNWFKNVLMPKDILWIIVGDFNLIRRSENRNKPGRDYNLMVAFNEAINKLGIIEVPVSGQAFIWSNHQQNPLLERLDWLFISQPWSLEFPDTKVKTLTRDTSDYVPCVISFKTGIPKPRIFRFDNFWLQHDYFQQVFHESWSISCQKTDPTLRLTAKLKTTMLKLKEWHNEIPKLAKTIENTKLVIQLTDMIEECRDLEVQEWNFRDILQQHLNTLLDWQKKYW